MSLLHEKQVRVLKLFERLSVAASGEPVPADHRDARLASVGLLPNSAFFSCFLPEHLNEAKSLIEIFCAANDFDDFVHLAEQARTFVNSTLFAFAAEVAILHRADSRGVIVPPIQEIFPTGSSPPTPSSGHSPSPPPSPRETRVMSSSMSTRQATS
ncbi:hemocyanin A chain [Caerostris darwini]|uniref:Hemocyanin A chain n=1 Tax=Caerostris darwini TaxID=1538125 RepID=A0AAV4W594_9ARAC|nr:hemocyanin A chain [Caerostris darwini]